MPDGEIYPLEFYVVGTPLSVQGRSASIARWKEQVREAGRQRGLETADFWFLDNRPLTLTIYYFPVAPMIGDVDNIVKPIMDALKAIAYLDDQVIERASVQKFEPEVDWTFAEPSDQLSAALESARGSDSLAPVVYIRIDDDLSWRRL